MKGFGIEIKNNLLEQKHIERMGVSVWMYMWCIDKMTSIDEDGIGKVLGGKPIKYEEVRSDLGVSIRTYRRWTSTLEKHGYINIKTAPYGLIITVNKAHKRFGKRYAENGTPEKTERSAENGTIGVPETAHQTTKNGTPNKTRTVRQSSRTKQLSAQAPNDDASVEENKWISDCIKAFEPVNPSYETLYNRKPQRHALLRLGRKYGAAKVSEAIQYAVSVYATDYAPTITTPVQLETKLGLLIAHYKRQKAKTPMMVEI